MDVMLQGCLSYPFFDPVLTDRAFLAKPSTMLGAFLLGGVVAALFIFFFGFVGIYGNAVATLRPSWCAAPLCKLNACKRKPNCLSSQRDVRGFGLIMSASVMFGLWYFFKV